MKDYSTNSFQKATFITSYDVDREDDTIMVNYADGRAEQVPYSVEEEKRILTLMRQQVLNAGRFKDTVTKAFKIVDFKDKLYKILNAIYLGMIIGLGIRASILHALMFVAITLPIRTLDFRKIRKNRKELKMYREALDDYDKSLAFIQNEEAFSNKKVLKPRVILHTTDRVKFVLSSGLLEDKYHETPKEPGKLPFVDFRLINDHSLLKDPETRRRSEEDERLALSEGYEDLSDREVPLINVNSIEYLSFRQLSKLHKLTTQNNKGKVLIKVKNIEWEEKK